jgi:hypothetical protein
MPDIGPWLKCCEALDPEQVLTLIGGGHYVILTRSNRAEIELDALTGFARARFHHTISTLSRTFFSCSQVVAPLSQCLPNEEPRLLHLIGIQHLYSCPLHRLRGQRRPSP